MSRFHISVGKEIDPKKLGLRATDHREIVLAQIREFGGFTVFWAGANLNRARMIDRLDECGVIVRLPVENDTYPWCSYKIAEESV